MEKRGLSHVEAVLSFIIFISFLIFAFFFFSPFSGNRVLDSSLDYTFREIDASAKVRIESYSVKINTLLQDPLAIPIDTDIENPGVRVENNVGNKLDSGFDGSSVHFDSSIEDFVVIRFSEAFVSGNVVDGNPLSEDEYTISSSNSEKIFSEEKFLLLSNNYHNGYEDLKEQFNLPGRVDFGFVLDFGGGDLIEAVRFIPEELEVIAKQKRIEIIRTEENGGGIEFADLIVRIW
jgi:hypothetical protein